MDSAAKAFMSLRRHAKAIPYLLSADDSKQSEENVSSLGVHHAAQYAFEASSAFQQASVACAIVSSDLERWFQSEDDDHVGEVFHSDNIGTASNECDSYALYADDAKWCGRLSNALAARIRREWSLDKMREARNSNQFSSSDISQKKDMRNNEVLGKSNSRQSLFESTGSTESESEASTTSSAPIRTWAQIVAAPLTSARAQLSSSRTSPQFLDHTVELLEKPMDKCPTPGVPRPHPQPTFNKYTSVHNRHRSTEDANNPFTSQNYREDQDILRWLDERSARRLSQQVLLEAQEPANALSNLKSAVFDIRVLRNDAERWCADSEKFICNVKGSHRRNRKSDRMSSQYDAQSLIRTNKSERKLSKTTDKLRARTPSPRIQPHRPSSLGARGVSEDEITAAALLGIGRHQGPHSPSTSESTPISRHTFAGHSERAHKCYNLGPVLRHLRQKYLNSSALRSDDPCADSPSESRESVGVSPPRFVRGTSGTFSSRPQTPNLTRLSSYNSHTSDSSPTPPGMAQSEMLHDIEQLLRALELSQKDVQELIELEARANWRAEIAADRLMVGIRHLRTEFDKKFATLALVLTEFKKFFWDDAHVHYTASMSSDTENRLAEKHRNLKPLNVGYDASVSQKSEDEALYEDFTSFSPTASMSAPTIRSNVPGVMASKALAAITDTVPFPHIKLLGAPDHLGTIEAAVDSISLTTIQTIFNSSPSHTEEIVRVLDNFRELSRQLVPSSGNMSLPDLLGLYASHASISAERFAAEAVAAMHEKDYLHAQIATLETNLTESKRQIAYLTEQISKHKVYRLEAEKRLSEFQSEFEMQRNLHRYAKNESEKRIARVSSVETDLARQSEGSTASPATNASAVNSPLLAAHSSGDSGREQRTSVQRRHTYHMVGGSILPAGHALETVSGRTGSPLTESDTPVSAALSGTQLPTGAAIIMDRSRRATYHCAGAAAGKPLTTGGTFTAGQVIIASPALTAQSTPRTDGISGNRSQLSTTPQSRLTPSSQGMGDATNSPLDSDRLKYASCHRSAEIGPSNTSNLLDMSLLDLGENSNANQPLERNETQRRRSVSQGEFLSTEMPGSTTCKPANIGHRHSGGRFEMASPLTAFQYLSSHKTYGKSVQNDVSATGSRELHNKHHKTSLRVAPSGVERPSALRTEVYRDRRQVGVLGGTPYTVADPQAHAVHSDKSLNEPKSTVSQPYGTNSERHGSMVESFHSAASSSPVTSPLSASILAPSSSRNARFVVRSPLPSGSDEDEDDGRFLATPDSASPRSASLSPSRHNRPHSLAPIQTHNSGESERQTEIGTPIESLSPLSRWRLMQDLGTDVLDIEKVT